jgi:mono/diheme cytochrome c family protein
MASNRTRLMFRTIAATLAVLALLGAAGAALLLKSGWYDVGASTQHWQLVHTVLEQGMHDSVRHHARAVAVPAALDQPARIARGAAVYRDQCLQCHGAPGVAQADFAKAMQPVPGPLVDAAARWQPRELYWITRHGIKMSGMPAWALHLEDDDIWSVVAFMRHLPTLSAPAFSALVSAQPASSLREGKATRLQGDPERGRTALAQYACNACHMVPGVTGPKVYVGKPLAGLAGRKYIAGVLPNTQANLIAWIRNPHQVDSQTAMPVQGVTEQDAIDISAYLLLRR